MNALFDYFQPLKTKSRNMALSPRKLEVMVGVRGKAAKLNKSFYEIENFYFAIDKAKVRWLTEPARGRFGI